MKLGMVTYNLGKDWDVPTIIENCTETGFEGVELRTTHAHGVEVDLTKEQRAEVKKQFDDSPIQIAGLGSAFDYHSDDPEQVRKNIEGTKEYIALAQDVGAPGVKVRPNGKPENVSLEDTIKQIGESLRECGEFAEDYDVVIRLEVHGRPTSHVPSVAKMIEIADHPKVKVCWNSNMTDRLEDGTITEHFNLVADKIGLCHITQLWNREYPWRELFANLQRIGYEGFCLAEVPESCEPIRFMQMYHVLFDELCMAKAD